MNKILHVIFTFLTLFCFVGCATELLWETKKDGCPNFRSVISSETAVYKKSTDDPQKSEYAISYKLSPDKLKLPEEQMTFPRHKEGFFYIKAAKFSLDYDLFTTIFDSESNCEVTGVDVNRHSGLPCLNITFNLHDDDMTFETKEDIDDILGDLPTDEEQKIEPLFWGAKNSVIYQTMNAEWKERYKGDFDSEKATIPIAWLNSKGKVVSLDVNSLPDEANLNDKTCCDLLFAVKHSPEGVEYIRFPNIMKYEAFNSLDSRKFYSTGKTAKYMMYGSITDGQKPRKNDIGKWRMLKQHKFEFEIHVKKKIEYRYPLPVRLILTPVAFITDLVVVPPACCFLISTQPH